MLGGKETQYDRILSISKHSFVTPGTVGCPSLTSILIDDAKNGKLRFVNGSTPHWEDIRDVILATPYEKRIRIVKNITEKIKKQYISTEWLLQFLETLRVTPDQVYKDAELIALPEEIISDILAVCRFNGDAISAIEVLWFAITHHSQLQAKKQKEGESAETNNNNDSNSAGNRNTNSQPFDSIKESIRHLEQICAMNIPPTQESASEQSPVKKVSNVSPQKYWSLLQRFSM